MVTTSFSPIATYPDVYKPVPAAGVKPTLFLADDHFLVLETLSLVLVKDFAILGVTTDESSVVSDVKRLQPDIALLDISMPGMSGLVLAKAILEAAPLTKVVFLTMHATQKHSEAAFRAGASGYVLKSSRSTELITALKTVLSGGTYLSPLLQGAIPVSASRELSERQCTVLKLIAEGKSAKQVAYQLGISQRTAEFHKTSIVNKLKLRTTAELTRYAIARGLTA